MITTQVKLLKDKRLHVLLKPWEALILIVTIHQRDHPCSIEASLCKASRKWIRIEALLVEALPCLRYNMHNMAPCIFNGAPWVFLHVALQVGSVMPLLIFVLPSVNLYLSGQPMKVKHHSGCGNPLTYHIFCCSDQLIDDAIYGSHQKLMYPTR